MFNNSGFCLVYKGKAANILSPLGNMNFLVEMVREFFFKLWRQISTKYVLNFLHERIIYFPLLNEKYLQAQLLSNSCDSKVFIDIHWLRI